jgi:hypothetical protein
MNYGHRFAKPLINNCSLKFNLKLYSWVCASLWFTSFKYHILWNPLFQLPRSYSFLAGSAYADLAFLQGVVLRPSLASFIRERGQSLDCTIGARKAAVFITTFLTV